MKYQHFHFQVLSFFMIFQLFDFWGVCVSHLLDLFVSWSFGVPTLELQGSILVLLLPIFPFWGPLWSLWLPLGFLLVPVGFLWLPFGSLLAPFGSLLAPFGSLWFPLAPFWFPLALRWFRLGSLVALCCSLGVHSADLQLLGGFLKRKLAVSNSLDTSSIHRPCL